MSIGFNQLNGPVVSDVNGNTTLGTLSSQLQPNANKNNTAVGFGALRINSGDHNVALGLNALANNSGSNNVAVGENALYNPTVAQSGNSNIAIGNNALIKNTKNDNVAIGHNADAGPYTSCILLGNNAISKRDNEIGIGGIPKVILPGASIA